MPTSKKTTRPASRRTSDEDERPMPGLTPAGAGRDGRPANVNSVGRTNAEELDHQIMTNPPQSSPNFDDELDGGFDSPSEPIHEDLAGTPQSTALTAYSDQPTFGRDEIVIPRLRIAQGLTKEVQDGEASPGQILLSGFEALDEVTIVPLRFARMRELRGEGEERNTVLCSSSDAVRGIGEPGGDCNTCPMKEWSEKVVRGKETRVPPPCSFIFSYMVYIVEHQQVAVLDFRRTSERTGRLMNTLVAQRGLRQFAVTLAAEIKSEGSRRFAVPTLSPTTVDASVLQMARSVI